MKKTITTHVMTHRQIGEACEDKILNADLDAKYKELQSAYNDLNKAYSELVQEKAGMTIGYLRLKEAFEELKRFHMNYVDASEDHINNFNEYWDKKAGLTNDK